MKDKDRKTAKLTEIKETLQLNAACDPGLDPGRRNFFFFRSKGC